jgi:hypothetical protein
MQALRMDPRKSKDFKTIERDWYRKLKETGFEDIEDTSRPDRMLKSWHSFRHRKFSTLQIDCVKTYYDNADELLTQGRFSSREIEQIWAFHCEGLSCREIERRINRFKKKSMINRIIRSIEKGIK